ncbi:MAG: DUF45 domain-containing protein [Oscillospiraceae bacterium]|nr:DUF45 domain-containing protein [Oscillospiraceae bacterium]
MIRGILLGNQELSYELEYKKVKNVNLRIKPNGTIYVSANKRVPIDVIENFILSKESFILNALEKFNSKRHTLPNPFYSEKELCSLIKELCKAAYPYYQKLGMAFPEIRFRRMISRWGSCHPVKKVLTFNTALMYAPRRCAEYVVWHEFTHFLHPNHSKAFYAELSKVCPNWKESRRILKEINIRTGE